MRDGIKGWKKAGYPVVGNARRLDDLIALNRTDFKSLCIGEQDARQLKNCCFVDFRDKSAYEKNHVSGANHVEYAAMFSKPMMEELNKSNTLVIIHEDKVLAGVIAATLKLMDYPDVYILR
ncbi:MAG: rhodanese-like domain-containing protein [Desulfobacter sp.]|nr:rhodanese-like domain-containing protein [Desulfobacter sp.]WDP85853.1 MAG: rhodanese-like domain-containing protein [Desulfobacter sp.]